MPKHNRNHKKKKRKKNQKNKQHPNHNKHHENKSKNNSKSNQSKSNDNRIKHVIDIKIKKPDNSVSSPTTIHYDADISDSDTNHHYNLSPTITEKKSKMQILRSAKITHRTHDNSSANTNQNSTFSQQHSPTISPTSPISPISKTKNNYNISYLSPSFHNQHTPSLISQHRLSPLPSLHRAASEPIISHSPRSILRSYTSDSSTSDSNNNNVTFGAVEVHEFNLLAGSESDGVPEDGGYSLYLDQQEINNDVLNVDQYEKQRYQRWKQRAQCLHWNKKKLHKAMEDPERYLFTAGRCDAFYSSLTPKEREKRLSIDKKFKKQHCAELSSERMELDKLRSSRRKNNIFCNCKPLSAMSTSELKIVAQQYGIKVYKGRKVKKGFLINQLKSKVLNHRDICCWDRISCSCVAAEIDCHCGTQERNFQCGCVKFHKKCVNEFGRYVYKQPYYAKTLIKEWEKCYQDQNENEKQNTDAVRVSFKL